MKSIKCVVVGDEAVGKTSMLITFANDSFPSEYCIPRTVSNHVSVEVKINAESQIAVSFWDTVGLEEYDPLRPMSYIGADVILLCFSIGNKVSMENIATKWYPEVHRHCPTASIILVGMKTDLRGSFECVEYRVGFAVAKVIGAKAYLECSAITQTGLTELFQNIIYTIVCPKNGSSSVAITAKTNSTCNLI